MKREKHHRRAFTRSELLALLVTLSIGAALALAATRQMRQDAMTTSSLSQLRWLASATSSYAADSNDQFWSFSWKAGTLPHSTPGLPTTAATDLRAAVIQAIEILHRLGGRTDIPIPAGWIPHVQFGHLPLVDYIGRELPDFNLVAPGDKHRLNWARDPAAFDTGAFLPFQPEPSESAKRWPYTSSYEPSTGFWDLARSPSDRVYQGGIHRTWIVPTTVKLGGADLTEVAFPSQKVMLHDTEQRELGAEGRFFADPAARIAILMADGSAGVRATIDSNYGWNPSQPTAGFPTGITRFRYYPSTWEAPEPMGALVAGHYRWTRGGIKGRDFGGPEVDTGQP